VRVQRDGVQLHGIEAGDGLPVVLLHGFGQSSESEWVRTGLMDAVAEHRRAVAFDARGHGRSDRPTAAAAYGDRAMAWDVVAIADELALGAYDVAGYSMGAATAVEVAFVDRRVRRLLLGGLGDDTTPTWTYREQATLLGAGDPRAWFHPEHHDAAAAWLAGAILPQLAGLDLSVIGPATVVNGVDDKPASFADRFRGGRAVVVPGDHGAALHTPEFRAALSAWCLEGA